MDYQIAATFSVAGRSLSVHRAKDRNIQLLFSLRSWERFILVNADVKRRVSQVEEYRHSGGVNQVTYTE